MRMSAPSPSRSQSRKRRIFLTALSLEQDTATRHKQHVENSAAHRLGTGCAPRCAGCPCPRRPRAAAAISLRANALHRIDGKVDCDSFVQPAQPIPGPSAAAPLVVRVLPVTFRRTRSGPFRPSFAAVARRRRPSDVCCKKCKGMQDAWLWRQTKATSSRATARALRRWAASHTSATCLRPASRNCKPAHTSAAA